MGRLKEKIKENDKRIKQLDEMIDRLSITGDYETYESVECCDDTENIGNISLEPTNNGGRHLDICNRLNKIYLAKNKDYGNSFGKQYQKHGILSSVIRLDDKMNRLNEITKPEAKVEVEDETIEDTLLDMANYAIMTLMELEGQYE